MLFLLPPIVCEERNVAAEGKSQNRLSTLGDKTILGESFHEVTLKLAFVPRPPFCLVNRGLQTNCLNHAENSVLLHFATMSLLAHPL